MLLEVNFSDWKVILIDIIIILIVALETYSGYKKGFLESSIKLLGFIGAFVGAYILKSPLSILMYTHLPFFKFEGLFRGMSSLKIAKYKIIIDFTKPTNAPKILLGTPIKKMNDNNLSTKPKTFATNFIMILNKIKVKIKAII